MKTWLPVLLENLGESPILALANARNLARAAVLNREGRVLAGSLGSPALTAQAMEAAPTLAPRQTKIIDGPTPLILERLEPDEKTRRFWHTAQENQDGAWASWLLTMPRREGAEVRLVRHLLSAFGPWTTPRLPVDNEWCLLPLKAGLGRLFIFGDDALAMETAALAARVGLSVTWLSAVDQSGPELMEARGLADFDLQTLPDWPHLTAEFLAALGVKPGVKALVTAAQPEDFLESLRAAGPSRLTLSGEAEEAPAGLFAKPVTISQKALGLIAEML
ncbi:MAG: hypothetical protein LBV79_09790 [Candidatus Adiutrix sp.]|jgi:hypothetical protein|nr:hypothetical protein [Candidatus Adiutrix sp.]